MALDLTALVAPLSDEAPSGQDLCYETGRAEIEAAFERSVSDGGSAERSEKEWRDTIKQILAEAALTRDIWLPVYLMRAAAFADDFSQLVQGAQFLALLLEERWDDVHPQLDEYGFIGRKTPCESLVRKGDFLTPLARLPLLIHERLGRYSGDDFDRLRKEGARADGHGMFLAMLEAGGLEQLEAVIAGLDDLREAIGRADAVLTRNADGDTATNFQPLYDEIDRIRNAAAAHVPGMEQQAPESLDSGSYGGQSGGNSSGSSGGELGAIRTRDDVFRALDAINAYFERNEPTSPVPFALRRAREWISLDFMAVLEDIAPGGMDEASRVLKSNRGGGSDYSSAASSGGSSSDGWGGADAGAGYDDSGSDTSSGW